MAPKMVSRQEVVKLIAEVKALTAKLHEVNLRCRNAARSTTANQKPVR